VPFLFRSAACALLAFYVQAEGKEHVELGENSLTVRRGDKK